ncbi:MAG: hypothetical protein ABIH38_00975 [Patescibacteria group bacterium]
MPKISKQNFAIISLFAFLIILLGVLAYFMGFIFSGKMRTVKLFDLIKNEKIIYKQETDKEDLLYQMDNKNKALLTEIPAGVDQLKMSPDGKYILFYIGGMSESHYYLFNIATKSLKEINLAEKGQILSIIWNNDGQSIYYLAGEYDKCCISKLYLYSYNFASDTRQLVNDLKNIISNQQITTSSLGKVLNDDIYIYSVISEGKNLIIDKYNLEEKSGQKVADFSAYENPSFNISNQVYWLDNYNVITSFFNNSSRWVCVVYNLQTNKTKEITNCSTYTAFESLAKNFSLAGDNKNMVYFDHPNLVNDKETNLNFYDFENNELKVLDQFTYQVSVPVVTWLPDNSGVLYSYDQQTFVYDFNKNKIKKVLLPEGVELLNIYSF